MRSATLAEKSCELKRYEHSCYQICHYLLREEKAAVHAAQAVLLQLYAREDFWSGPESERQRMLRRLSIKLSLAERIPPV